MSDNKPPEPPTIKKEAEPVLALSLFCMGEQKKILEKLDEAKAYISGLTPKEFEGRHETDGIIIKISNLQ